jgi:type IV pilus assembly protein PilA
MCSNARMNRQSGFTWIEMLIVIAVVGILAALAIPSMQDSIIRKQVKDALAIAEVAKAGVQAVYTLTGELPADNKGAGLPEPEKMVSLLVANVKVVQGAITLEFGNSAHAGLVGKHVTLRPAVVPGEMRVPIAWLCHNVEVPSGMEARGRDETDVRAQWLPLECRGKGPPA